MVRVFNDAPIDQSFSTLSQILINCDPHRTSSPCFKTVRAFVMSQSPGVSRINTLP